MGASDEKYMAAICQLESERDSLRVMVSQLRETAKIFEVMLDCLHKTTNALPKCWGLDEFGKRVQETPIVPDMPLWYKSIGGITETRAVAVEQTRIRAIGQGDGRYLGAIISADKCYDSIAAIEVAYPEAD